MKLSTPQTKALTFTKRQDVRDAVYRSWSSLSREDARAACCFLGREAQKANVPLDELLEWFEARGLPGKLSMRAKKALIEKAYT